MKVAIIQTNVQTFSFLVSRWLRRIYLFFVHVCFDCVYVHDITCMPSANGRQKRALNPLELEQCMTVNYHVGARSRSWVSRRETNALN